MSAHPRIAIIGGGPSGSLLAILLARRGLAPVVIERSQPPSAALLETEGGRSINLALAARGIEALRTAGLDQDVAELMIPMRGRMLHDARGTQRFLRYGQRRHEEIYSVSRATLTALLQRIAADHYGVEYRFGQRCVDVDLATGAPIVESADRRLALDADVVLACDGAGSEVRRALAEGGAIKATEELLDHGYKELTIAPTHSNHETGGDFALDPKALHIWPRGGFMLIALPNPDKSFTATLFLPHAGASSFESVSAAGAGEFFAREFPDALALMPNVENEYASHPTGILGTVHCEPWSYRGRLLLVGDAAHAIVPFHGQGMNAAFEDCIVLDGLIGEHATAFGCDWAAVFERFEEARAPNTRAIAEMAVENYREMRDEVRDPKFQLRAQLSFELERRFPGKFIPRYSMVMFHPEIPYAEAQRRGAVQLGILRELTADLDKVSAVDFTRAAALIAEGL